MASFELVTPLKGKIILSDSFHEQEKLKKDASLYKFLWVSEGFLSGEIDNIPFTIGPKQMLTLSPLNHLNIQEYTGMYHTLLFDSNFYCIFGHDDEVSCNGLLFTGTSERKQWDLSDNQYELLCTTINEMEKEFQLQDSLKEEMLRILLKRFIISCTRLAKQTFTPENTNEKNIEIIRQYYVLVDQHFREKRLVRDYADLLHRSPKTLSNIFATAGLPSPLRIIHQRIEAEAKRLLLYTRKSAKEIAFLLGFEDQASFSRFFSHQSGESVSEYRKKIRKE